MAFTEEQEQQILSAMGQFSEFVANQSKQAPADTPKDDAKDADADSSLQAEAKKSMAKEAEFTELNKNLESSVQFNMGIAKFIEENKYVLPEASAKIVEIATGKHYTSGIEQANVVRKGLIEEYLTIQANIDCLPVSTRAKALEFKALAEDAKLAKSSTYWEIVEVGTALAKNKARASELNKAGGNSGNDEWKSRCLELGSIYRKGK